jgi:hypothetical protein
MVRWISLVSPGSHRQLKIFALLGVLMSAAACSAEVPVRIGTIGQRQPVETLEQAHARIDRLYLETAAVLSQQSGGEKIDIKRLAGDIDAVSADDTRADPCLAQKRSQLMPILISLAVIDGMPDRAERRSLQAEAYRRLEALGDPTTQPVMGDICFGQKFPNLAKMKK